MTRCIIAYDVASDRELWRLQSLLNAAPSASQRYSDQLAASTNLAYYPGQHEALPNKSQTHSVEGDNADLHHDLTVKLLVYAWNRRQLYRRQHPEYPAHVFQFAYP